MVNIENLKICYSSSQYNDIAKTCECISKSVLILKS